MSTRSSPVTPYDCVASILVPLTAESLAWLNITAHGVLVSAGAPTAKREVRSIRVMCKQGYRSGVDCTHYVKPLSSVIFKKD